MLKVRPQFWEKDSWLPMQKAAAHSATIWKCFLVNHDMMEVSHPTHTPDGQPFAIPPVKTPSKKKKVLGCWGHHCQIKCSSFGHLRWQFWVTCRKTQTVCCKAKEITFSYFMFTYTYRMNPRTILTLQVYLFPWKKGEPVFQLSLLLYALVADTLFIFMIIYDNHVQMYKKSLLGCDTM